MAVDAERGRKWFAAWLVLLVSVIGLGYRFLSDPLRDVPLLDGSTSTVVPGIHLLGGLGPAAAYVVETSDGLVLVDSGLDGDAQPLKGAMSKLGLDWNKLRAIFLTHVHGDHCGGAEHLRAATGATVYAGQADAPVLTSGESRDAFFSTYQMPDHSPHPTTVDVALQGDETIAFGDVRMRVLGTPGHSPGSTCYLVERAGLRVLFAGDVITRLGEEPLGTYTAYLAPRYRGEAESYLTSLERLRTLPVPDLVLPGHPSASRTPQSPHITRERWEAMLDEGIHDMRKLVARYEADGKNFLDGHPKRLLPDLYYLGDFAGVAVYAFLAETKLYVVDAPGGPGLFEFLKTRQQELRLKTTGLEAILLTACGERETAGLKELVEQTGATVVSAPAGMDEIRQRCPAGTNVISAKDLANQDWFPVKPLLLQGRGVAPVAYVMSWAGKKVIFSGRIPASVDPQSREELHSELARSKSNAEAYVDSIRQLINTRPDLWLPAVPANGQNANIYDKTWHDTLEKNYWAARGLLQRR